jgi:nucleotide-binding universal stress UspA family protein
MTGPVVVGYTATKAGRDAVAIGTRLAEASGRPLANVIVLPSDERSVITPPDAGYDRYLRGQAEEWLAEAAQKVPDAVPHRSIVRYGESFGDGLVAVADEIGAGYIVVGAANGGSRGRHRLGSTATELLHSSDVPVVLVPRGARKLAARRIRRVTVALGKRPGAEVLLDEAVALATAARVPVRLLSLVTVDLPPSVDTGVIRLAGAAHADDVLAQVQAALPSSVETQVVVARGESIEEAVQHLDWDPHEVVMVGSSRLAQPRRLFLGSTAAKMLHELPVPLIVVPRTRQGGSSSEGSTR